MSVNTYNALLARGFDSRTATTLTEKKMSLSKLKQMNENQLKNLGLNDRQIHIILSEPRPPIPLKTVYNLLHKSKRTCCICRDQGQPIIIHHIKEWSVSKSHAEKNLVVLCLNHHDLAHTKKGISVSLPTNEIQFHKKKWESDIGILDAKAILGLKDTRDYARWDWVNIRRISELYLQLNLSLPQHHVIDYLKNLLILDQNGLLTDGSKWQTSKPSFWYIDFGEGMYVGFYLDILVRTVVSKLHLVELTNITNKGELKSIVKSGDFVAIQRGFYFKQLEKFIEGKSQLVRGYYRGHGVRIEFTFDAWYCTSSSSRFDSMRGHREKTILGFVTSISESNGILTINLSCLAAGSYFSSARSNIF